MYMNLNSKNTQCIYLKTFKNRMNSSNVSRNGQTSNPNCLRFQLYEIPFIKYIFPCSAIVLLLILNTSLSSVIHS